MGFDLTGYEQDNMDVRPLAAYTIGAIIALTNRNCWNLLLYVFYGRKIYTRAIFRKRYNANH